MYDLVIMETACARYILYKSLNNVCLHYTIVKRLDVRIINVDSQINVCENNSLTFD